MSYPSLQNKRSTLGDVKYKRPWAEVEAPSSYGNIQTTSDPCATPAGKLLGLAP
jgi:hypothetical protein